MMQINLRAILSMTCLAIVFTVILSCQHDRSVQTDVRRIDSIIYYSDVPREQLVDSMLHAGMISQLAAAYYNEMTYAKEADEYGAYLKRSYEMKVNNKADRIYHLRIVDNYISYYVVLRKYDAALQLFTDEQATITTDELNNPEIARINAAMQCLVGVCNVYKEHFKEGEALLVKGFNKLVECTKDTVNFPYQFSSAFQYPVMATNAYYNLSQYDASLKWTDRTEQLLNYYMQTLRPQESLINYMKDNIYIARATIYAIQGRKKEATEYYEKYMRTKQTIESISQLNTVDYLLAMGQYAKAADIMEQIEPLLKNMNMPMSLDNIVNYIVNKYKANLWAGRRDSALAVGSRIIFALDSAKAWIDRDKSIELATLYETNQKEQKIAEQEASLNQQRIIGLLVTIILLTVFFTVYTIHKRRSARRLAEMKAAQERIESELRIARDIQMSMVPSTFPDRDGLDMYASMTPAKEVGGDLYGYVINGSNLYFAVGDVSGKGVPASLFMAQVTRLFRTMANQGLMPAEICTHMNNELSGDDNVSGMFVTMFLGMLNMDTGHLNFCNAGHNPPVIGGGKNQGEFLEMIANAPIGLFPELEYEGEEIESIKGRALFVYTDGLNEAEDMEQKQFGDEHMLEILRNTHFESARQVVETLYNEVQAHRHGADPNDDLTILCLKVS